MKDELFLGDCPICKIGPNDECDYVKHKKYLLAKGLEAYNLAIYARHNYIPKFGKGDIK